MIRVICDKLQKQLYPGKTLRLLHQFKVAAFDRPKHIKAHQQLVSNDLSRLKRIFELRGLDVFASKLDYYLDYERDKVSIPVTGQLDSSRTVTLLQHLERDGKGQYQLMGMDAGVYGSADPMHDVSITIDREFNLNRVQIGNLLQERPVYVFPDRSLGEPKDQWLHVARGGDYGDFQLNVFGPGYGYDLKKQLDELAAGTGIYRVTAADVITQLKDGHQVKLAGRHPLDQPVLTEASPGTGGILIRDLKQNIIGVDELFMGTKQAQAKQQENHLMISHKNKEQSNQQDQSFGISS
jgi:hypothetical protein